LFLFNFLTPALATMMPVHFWPLLASH